MSLIQFGAALIWLFVFVYAILGAIDFGSSFWRWYFQKRGNWVAESLAYTYVSPTWEFINSFLILIPVTMTGLFPKAVFGYGTILLVPATLLLILVALRGAYWQFGYASLAKRNQTVTVVGLTGLLLPGVFLTLLAVSQGGYVVDQAGTLHLLAGTFFTSPQVYVFAVFGILLSLYLSALFLARYAYLGHQWLAYETFRKTSQWMGPLSLLFGLLALLLPGGHGGVTFMPKLAAWWPLAVISLLAFLLAQMALVSSSRVQGHKGRPQLALALTLLQLLVAHLAYGAAHASYWLYPYLGVSESASNKTMFLATFWVLGLGTMVLVPVVLWFRRLFIADSKYVKDKVKAS